MGDEIPDVQVSLITSRHRDAYPDTTGLGTVEYDIARGTALRHECDRTGAHILRIKMVMRRSRNVRVKKIDYASRVRTKHPKPSLGDYAGKAKGQFLTLSASGTLPKTCRRNSDGGNSFGGAFLEHTDHMSRCDCHDGGIDWIWNVENT